MPLPTEFWTIDPAGNKILYSAYPNGVLPSLSWTTVPNYLNQTTALSVDLKVTYLTFPAGNTITMAVNGTLPTGWTFSGTTLSYNGTSVNSTPASITVTATDTTLGLYTISNNFTIQGAGSASSDTTAPTVPVGNALQSPATTSQVVIGGITPSDPGLPAVSGLVKINVKRGSSVIGHTTIGPGNNTTLTPSDIGPQSSTITQTGVDIAFTTTAQDAPYPTVDCWATDFQQITGTSWTATMKVSSFTATNGYSNVGLYARASMGQTAAFVGVITFPFAQGNGFLSKFRPASAGNDTNLQTAANSTSPVWLVLTRSGDTYTFFYSLDGNTLISLGSQTQIMGASVYVGPAATTSDGVSISVTAQQVSIQTLANWSYTDSTVAASNTYAYTATSQDVAGNVSAASNALNITTPSSGSSLINWATGLGREDASMMVGFGANYMPSSVSVAGTPPQDLASFITTPSYCTTYCPNCTWGNFEGSTLGDYNFALLEYMYNQCASAGKYLQIFIHGEAVPFVTASEAFSAQYLPAYLNDAGGANVYGGLQNIYFGTSFGGTVPLLGRTAVINAFCNMVIALCNHTMTTGPNAGTQVKNLPYFLGITVWETAYNLGQSGYPSWTGIDPSWGDANLSNWYANYANIVIPSLRTAVPNVMFQSRANWGINSYLIPIAQAALTYKWALGGGTDFTASPTNMDLIINGSVGGVDYRPSLPQVEFNESVAGGTYGDVHNGNSPWQFTSTAAAFIAAMQDSIFWNACLYFPSRYTGDVWTNSTYAEIMTAYNAAGSHLAVSSPPSGFRAGPFT